MKQAVLGIDFQFDFCNPNGALYVKGAKEDIQRASEFVRHNINTIEDIILSMDSHQPIHIAHQTYWRNGEGKQPELYSAIKKDAVKSGLWYPQYNIDLALDYLTKLENNGDVCTIWPEHCIIGTKGWSIDEVFFEALKEWALARGKSYELVVKGMYQATEHYSIFKAAVEYPQVEATLLNFNLIAKLGNYDRIFVMGEAADFCVLNSLKDLLHFAPDIASKVYVLTDCMSYIVDKNQEAQESFEKMKKQGVTFCLSTEI